MPGRKIPLINNQIYHIYNRGINKKPIFLDIRDYKRAIEIIKFYRYTKPSLKYSKYLSLSLDKRDDFLKELKKHSPNVTLHGFCFMPNHFHFLLEQIIDNGISTFMSNFQNSYTRYFNTKRNGIGPLLQGQFKAVYIEDDNQLLHVHRYIHLNPYSSFIVKKISDLKTYPWSSFPEYSGESNAKICNTEKIVSNFKNNEAYTSFIFNQADYQRELNKIKHLVLED